MNKVETWAEHHVMRCRALVERGYWNSQNPYIWASSSRRFLFLYFFVAHARVPRPDDLTLYSRTAYVGALKLNKYIYIFPAAMGSGRQNQNSNSNSNRGEARPTQQRPNWQF